MKLLLISFILVTCCLSSCSEDDKDISTKVEDLINDVRPITEVYVYTDGIDYITGFSNAYAKNGEFIIEWTAQSTTIFNLRTTQQVRTSQGEVQLFY